MSEPLRDAVGSLSMNRLSSLPPGNDGGEARVSAGFDLDEIHGQQPRQRVLIVDDDPDMVSLLKLTLRTAGMDVAGALNADEAIHKCTEFQPDIFLLDLMMPIVDGWETLKRLRKITDAPVVIVSAKGQRDEIVLGLDRGADDYVPKPFYPPEVVSRVRAVLRRAQASSPITARIFPDVDLLVDFDTHEIRFRGEVIDLPPKEFAVLAVLAKNAPRPVSYETIAMEVWGEDTPDVRNRIKWLIHRLRNRLEDSGAEPSLILNRVGFGYQLNAEHGEES
jgi:two-component system KDP operon response regulator KdpE